LPALRRESTQSVASSDCHFECPPGGFSGTSSAAASSACLAELPGGAEPPPAPAPLPAPRSLTLGDGTSLQLLPPETAAALAASGLLPDLGAAAPAGFLPLGFAVQPVEVEVEGQRMQLSALHAVYNVDGQPMLCAQVRRDAAGAKGDSH
jgi:hypothetical protein